MKATSAALAALFSTLPLLAFAQSPPEPPRAEPPKEVPREVRPRPSESSTPVARCMPECRDGYTCSAGFCVSACNPGCGATERCVGGLRCEPLDGSAAHSSSSSSSVPPSEKPRLFAGGIRVGMLMPAEVNVETTTYTSGMGPFMALSFDSIIVNRLSVGLLFSFAHTKSGETNIEILNAGIAIRERFPVGQFEIRPGFTFSYQRFLGDIPDAQGFNPGMSIEFAMKAGRYTSIFFDGGFISQPVGGTDTTDVTFGPIPYFAMGADFGG